MTELEQYLTDRFRAVHTCPRCDIYSPRAWCPMCGDEWPWPKADQPFTLAESRGICG